jgi:hypothetical protein
MSEFFNLDFSGLDRRPAAAESVAKALVDDEACIAVVFLLRDIENLASGSIASLIEK